MRASRPTTETFPRRLLLWLSLLLVTPSGLQAEQLPIKQYTTADGLVRDSINRIVQDTHGFLWFCTPEGLSRFDGYDFTNYGTDEGLPHRAVNDLLEARDGSYWIATGAGVARFLPLNTATAQTRVPLNRATESHTAGPTQRFVIYRFDKSDTHPFVNVLFEDHTGTIWCGTGSGLFRLEQPDGQWAFRFVNIGLSPELTGDSPVNALLEDAQGTLWVGAESGLYRRWPEGRVERYTTQQGLPDNHVKDVLAEQTTLWVGTTEGLCQMAIDPKLNRAVVTNVYSASDGMASSFINSLFLSADGRLWIGTPTGLSEFLPAADQTRQHFRSYTVADGLSDVAINGMAEDHDGNLWIGTESGGAMKLARSGFTTYRERDGLGSIRVASIFENQEGELYVLGGQSISRFDGRRFTTAHPNLPATITHPGWGWYQNSFQDRRGEWWIATGEGLWRFPRVSRLEQLAHVRAKRIYTARDGLGSNDIFRLFEDSHGDIWISTVDKPDATLTRWEHATETFHLYSAADGIPLVAPTAFREDAAGQLWIGLYENGLLRYHAGRFTLFTPADGLPAGMIRGLHVDHTGRLWIASSQGGLGRIDDTRAEHPRFVIYTTAEGLASNLVTCVTEDQWGRIYAGTGRGLDRLDPASGHIKHYTAADGLSNNFVNVAFRDRQGALWLGTLQGLSRLVPEPERQQLPPPILIDGLHIAGVPRVLSDLGETALTGLELNADQNQLQIDFVGLSFAAGEALRYQFKLEGADSDWSAPNAQRTVNYASLSPGAYRFMVRAVNVDGVASSQPATISFKILPPIWQRWWFLTLVALLCGSLAYAFYRYRLGRLVELERVRTRIATDLHDDIGASLSRVAILSEVVKQQSGVMHEASTQRLTDIADTARSLVDSMSDIVWSIDPRRDDLRNVILRVRQFASDVLEAKGIKWELQSTPDLDRVKLTPEQRRHLFLIFKEALTNIARHAESGNVSLQIKVGGEQLHAEIRDDGSGLPSSSSCESENARGGHGLENMRARAAQVGGHLDIKSTPGAGTKITLSMPINKRHGMNMLFPRRGK